MLVLSRREGESIRIGDAIYVTLVRSAAGGVRLGIEAPPDVPIVRTELIGPEVIPGLDPDAMRQADAGLRAGKGIPLEEVLAKSRSDQ